MHQRWNVGAEALQRLRNSQIAHHVLFCVPGHRPERNYDDQKGETQAGQCQGQRDLVRRLLADGTLDQRYHAIEKGLPRKRSDFHHDPIGDNPRSAGDTRTIAARLTNHRSGFAGDRRFVDRCDSLDYLAVTGNYLARGNYDAVTRPQVGRQDLLDRFRPLSAERREFHCESFAATPPGPCRAPRPARSRNLRTAPSATARSPAR